jgi:peroxiredoxin
MSSSLVSTTAFFATALSFAVLVAAGCSAASPSASSGGGSPEPVGGEAPVANPAPAFTLTDADGVKHSLADYRGKWVVLEWVNPGCPFVRKHYDSKNMQTLQQRYTEKGVVWLAICSSAQGKQGWAEPAAWKERMASEGWSTTALLLDADGTVGRAYEAKTTPHMFVVDPRGGIVYRGAIDDVKSADQADVAKAKNHVAETLDAVMAGKAAPVAETAPYGCSVKY